MPHGSSTNLAVAYVNFPLGFALAVSISLHWIVNVNVVLGGIRAYKTLAVFDSLKSQAV